MVNGVSTLYEEPPQSDLSKNLAWVLDPGRQYVIQGYQQDNQTRKPFRVLSDADSAAATYSANTGLIHFHIMRSGDGSGSKNIAGNDPGTNDDPSGHAMNISLRGLSHSALGEVRTHPLARGPEKRDPEEHRQEVGAPRLDRQERKRRRRSDPERRGQEPCLRADDRRPLLQAERFVKRERLLRTGRGVLFRT